MFLGKLIRYVPRSTLRRGLNLFNRGEFESAALLFEEILRASREPAEDVAMCACEAYLEVARRRDGDGDPCAALQALERAATLRPGYADVHLRLGRLHEKLDQPQRAREAYAHALRINPRYFEARLSLARLLIRLEDGASARLQLQEAAQSGPEFAASELQQLIDTVPAQGAAPAPRRERLEALFEKLLSGPPSPVGAGIEVARAALRRGENALAIAELKKLLKLAPSFPDLHNLLGVAYDNEEMTDDAIEEFEQALRLNPAYADARLNLGLALFERGRDLEAERALRAIEAHQPGNKLVRNVLSQIESRSAAR